MLILTRRVGQSIFIDGERVKVQVLGIDRNGMVRLGIEAPQCIQVDRAEVHQRKQEQLALTRLKP